MILAGGLGTRLDPLTRGVSKHLLPVYDKPLIFYPITTLILAGVRNIMIITTPRDRSMFEVVLGDGSQWGVNLIYRTQDSPSGIPNGLLLAEDFVGEEKLLFILGDNLFYGTGLGRSLSQLSNKTSSKTISLVQENFGCEIFTYPVKDPENFGVVTLNPDSKLILFDEKPKNSESNLAITGMYIFDNNCFTYSKDLKPSGRGEVEIIDLIRIYHANSDLKINTLGRGTAWLDTGTFSNLHDAASFIKIIQERQGVKIGDPYEASQIQGWI